MKVRTRIAPSPTGDLHIGHVRTLLYDYALAKKHNGQFIVRVEDTDRNRYVEGSVERTINVINDYGINWDEGPSVGGPYAPYLQSERLDIYKEHAKKLIDQGNAYYCFCSQERLAKLREDQQKEGAAKTSYDKKCRNLSKDQVNELLSKNTPCVIRLRVPENEIVVLHDAVHGDISFDTNEVDDAILVKSDGFPTYHLAAMVDDHLMDITHVLRGIDWMPSSPLHILLYRYFGWEPPVFVHLPNLKEKGSNRKLGKRFGSVAAIDFLKEGYLPEALLNLLMFVGWNPGTNKEVYSLDEFISDFSIDKIQKTDLVVFDRDKLTWFNGYYIRNLKSSDLWHKLKNWSDRFEYSLNGVNIPDDYNVKVLDLVKDRMKNLSDFNILTAYFYDTPNVSREILYEFTSSPEKAKEMLLGFESLLTSISSEDWVSTNLDKICHDFVVSKGYTPKEAFMTLRSAISGERATPPLFPIFEVIGKPETLKRITKSIQKL